MKRLSREHLFYAFSPTIPPVMEMEPGEEIVVETYDCRGGRIRSEEQVAELADTSAVNPATGPIFVRGAQPGDTLAIQIEDIEVESPGIMLVRPGAGALGDMVTEPRIKIVPIEDEEAVMSDEVRLKIDPMIGVIGVAPREGAIDTFTPDYHGGNMDCKVIRKGAKVYLPICVPGALLGMGDVHTNQGDGEIVICGVETNAQITIQVELLKRAKLPLPFLESEEIVATIYSAEDLDAAAGGAVHRMLEFLTQIVGIPFPEAGWLMSAAGDLKICQVVDPLKTCRMEFPKDILAAYRFSMGNLR